MPFPPKKLIFAVIASICTALGLFAAVIVVIAFHMVDDSKASRELPQAAYAYRKAGLPWVETDFAPPVRVKDAENAGPILLQACKLVRKFPEQTNQIAEEVLSHNVKAATADLAPYDNALLLAKFASEKPHLDFHRDWDHGILLDFKDLRDVKKILRALGYRAEMEAQAGNFPAATGDLTAAKKLTVLLGEDPLFVSMLVQIACDQITLRAVQWCAASETKNYGNLDQLFALIDEHPIRPNYERALKEEAYMGLSSLRNLPPQYLKKVVTDGFDTDNHPFTNPTVVRTGYPDSNMSRAYLTRVLQTWTEVASHFKVGESDPVKLGEEMDAIGDRLQKQHETSYIIAKGQLPIFSEVATAILKDEAISDSTRALLKSLMIHAKSGAYPKSIAEIPGTWVDPFDKKPLRLRLTKEGIRIYSIGDDKVDDGGVTRLELPKDSTKKGDFVVSFPPIKPVLKRK